MPVERSAVLRVAELANIGLDASEAARLADDLVAILAHVEELARLELAGVVALGLAVEEGTPARPDETGADALHTGPALFAPGWDAPFFTVPRLAALDPDAEPADA